MILPQTNGIALNNQESEEGEKVELLDKSGKLTGLAESAIEDIFYRFDTVISNSIDVVEFNDFWE